jgi:hypothetical protein
MAVEFSLFLPQMRMGFDTIVERARVAEPFTALALRRTNRGGPCERPPEPAPSRLPRCARRPGSHWALERIVDDCEDVAYWPRNVRGSFYERRHVVPQAACPRLSTDLFHGVDERNLGFSSVRSHNRDGALEQQAIGGGKQARLVCGECDARRSVV